MSRFSVFLLLLLVGSVSYGQETMLLSFSYYNWGERMKMEGNGLEADAPANLAGVGLQFDYLTTNKNKGWLYSGALLTGSGTGGSSSTNPAYVASYQPFFGVMGSAAYFFRVEKRVYLEIGPMLLYRSLKWPESAGNVAKSGSDINAGLTANLRIRMFRNLDYCQSIGTLFARANTIWSLGLGYRF